MLETDLIIPFAGASMRQRIATGFECDLYLTFRQQRPRDRRAEQILVLVDASRTDHRPEVVLDELLTQIGDVIFRQPPKYDTPWPVSLLMIVVLIALSGVILERRVRGVEVVA